ncbi:MAG: YkgJ family cysteine cluster protein [Candidatus Woesearchaeota archaeon]
MAECKNCGGCCNHVAVEIDRPTSKRDYHEILWFLLHKDVKVFVDDENDWYIEFSTPCEWRQKGMCIHHESRPVICRDYSPDECVRNGEGDAEKLSFHTYDEFMEYLRKNRIDYKFKWQKNSGAKKKAGSKKAGSKKAGSKKVGSKKAGAAKTR